MTFIFFVVSLLCNHLTLTTILKNKKMEKENTILEEVKGLNYYDLLGKFELVGEVGIEDDKHYFFKYDDKTTIEYHDRADTTITTLSVEELIEYYS